jgi:hypothetical protein
MCPDRQILSVYFDGELESPWREKLEQHLEGCPQCRDRLETYRITRRRLFPSRIPEDRVKSSGDRVWEKMAITIRPGRGRSKFWSGSISVPLPVAAAAGLVMALAMAALITLRQPVRAPDPQLAGMEMQDMTPVSDMTTLLQYLGNEGSPDMVIIRLPDTTFKNAGEPQMLRAADYSRSAGSR